MIKKKYFVLTAVLLVGVVLLSGCMGGGSGPLDGDDEVEEVVDNSETEQVIQETFTALENEDKTAFNSLVSDDTTYHFKGELMNNEDPKTVASEEIYYDLMSYYEDQILSEINLDNLNIEDKSANGIVELTTDNYSEVLPMNIELKTSGDNLIITKFGFPEKTQITDEHNTIKEMITALESSNKDDFINSLNNETKFYENGTDDTDKLADTPSEFYDSRKTEINNMKDIDFDYINIIFLNTDSNKIILDILEKDTGIEYGIEMFFGYNEDESISVEKIIYYTDEKYIN